MADSSESWAKKWEEEGNELYKQGYKKLAGQVWDNSLYEEDKAEHDRDIANHLIDSASDEPIAKLATKVSEKLKPVRDFINGHYGLDILGKDVYVKDKKKLVIK